MSKRITEYLNQFGQVLFLALLLMLLHFGTRYNYLLFHSFAEIFSIVVAAAIFVLAWNSRHFNQSRYLLWIGIAYLSVAFLDLLHTLAYSGMGVLPGYGVNLPTQLWIAARYTESLSLFLALLWSRKKLSHTWLLTFYMALTGLLLLSIFHWDIFPVCYDEAAQKLTTFKITSEYIISLVLISTMVLAYFKRNEFDRRVYIYLQLTLFLSILSEILFTLYTDPYGFANRAGHDLKILSFIFVYKALVETGLSQPYRLLFRDLAERQNEIMRSRQEIQRTAADLKRSNEDLEQFAYATSHDLQEPLRMITGYLQLIQHRHQEQIPEEALEFLAYAVEGAENMQQLIQDLLSYSRIDMRGGNFQQIPLQNALDKALHNLKQTIQDNKAIITQSQFPEIIGDQSQLTRLFQNLISNAIKFRQQDRTPEIHISAERKSDHWQISVADNGIGMKAEDTEKIFTVFQRLHSRDEFPGTGIGLATCKKIVARHGGEISAVSELGQGSTFIFTLADIPPAMAEPTMSYCR